MRSARRAPRSLAAVGVWGVPLLVLALALAATGLLTAYLARTVADSDRAAFEAESSRTAAAVAERLGTVTTLLRGAAGLMTADGQVDREVFATYVARVGLRERYPGVLGIGFTRRIEPGEREAVLAEGRANWGPSFRLWPPRPEGEATHAIVLLEPQDERNRAAIGFDMGSEPVRREAMEAAAASVQPRASGRVTLVQEIDARRQAGFLMYLPVTRHAGEHTLRGFVYAPLRVGDLLDGVRQGREIVEYRLEDVTDAEPALLRDTRTDPGRGRLRALRELDVHGRTWQLSFSEGPGFETLSRRSLVPSMAVLSTGASLLLAGIAAVQGRARREAEAAAEEIRRRESEVRAAREREQRRSRRLQHLAAAAPGLVAAQSVDAVCAAVKAEAQRLLDSDDARVELDAHGAPPLPPRSLAVRLDAGVGSAPARLAVVPRPGADFDEDDEALLGQLAGMAAIALRNAQLYAELRDNDRRKDEFLAVLAHELRNPLAPLRSSLELLRRLPPGPGAERARAVAERQTTHMVRLIDDLLDVSRIARGTITLRREPVVLAEVVEAAVETSRPLLDARGHQLTAGRVDPSLRVLGDATRLAQVFSNLLNNAAHYTEPGGHVALAVAAEGGTAEVSVSDDGVGIEPEVLARVFDMFMQADRVQGRHGLGVGLTLASRLAALHGGSVRAESAGRDRGSRFTVTLPLLAGAGPAVARAHEPGPAAPARALDLLVVDDNHDAAESLAAALRLDGHQVRLAGDGPSALRAAAEALPEVAVLDIGMPGMDGHELARRLRELPDGASLRLVALTGWGQPGDRELARQAGFDLHLVKPVEHATLAAHLARLAGGARPGTPA